MNRTATVSTMCRSKALFASMIMLFLASCATPHREPTKEAQQAFAPEASVSQKADMISLSEVAKRYGYSDAGTNSSGRILFRRNRNLIEIDPNSRVAYFNGRLELLTDVPESDGETVWVAKSVGTKFRNLREKVVAKKAIKKAPLRAKPIPSNSLRGRHFVIDAGHGGKDGGTARHGVREKDITLYVAKEVAQMLRSEGARVTMTRTTDHKIQLNRRAQISNQKSPDAFISIHVNSAPNSKAAGVEVYSASNRSQGQRSDKLPKSKKLASALFRHLSMATPVKDRGVKPSPGFRVLKKNNHPSALVELGFVSNSKERSLLKRRSYQKRLAIALVAGIREYSRTI
ncbi:MAG: N-acetylmuramoyl-L-alanine amidase [Planctomycetota bacterium]|jgi:N-acetylmuramoyl-L-alanine amidase